MDYSLFYTVTNTANDILSWLFGLFVVGITIVLAIGTALDIAFIALPVFQDKMYDRQDKGFKLISHAAVSAVEESNQTGSSPMLLYLKRRIKVYAVTAIVIYAVMTNQPIRLTKLIWSFVEAVLTSLGILV